MVNFRVIGATEAHEQAYQKVVEVLREYCRQNPQASANEILAILGRAAGYCVGMYEAQAQEAARSVVTTNMDMAAKSVTGEQT